MLPGVFGLDVQTGRHCYQQEGQHDGQGGAYRDVVEIHHQHLGADEYQNGCQAEFQQMEALARKTLDGLSVRTVKSIRQTVSSLSGGQRQTVAIARAGLWGTGLTSGRGGRSGAALVLALSSLLVLA